MPIDRGTDKEDVIHIMKYYSTIKKDKIMPFAADTPYMWNPERNDTNELTKQKKTHRLGKGTYSCCGEDWGKGMVRESGMDMYPLLYSKWITNKNLLYSTWNSAQCHVAAWKQEAFRGKCVHVYVCLSTFGVHLKLS